MSTANLQEQNLISLLGIESLPNEQKIKIIDRVTTLVEKRLLLRILDFLSADLRGELEQLLKQNNQEAINTFISGNVPELSEWANEEVLAVKEELAEGVKQTL